MKSKILGLLLALPLVAAEPVGFKYWSAADLKAMSKTLANKADARTSNQDLGKWGTDRALMVHRSGTGSAEVHENDADVIVVVSGGGTLLVGGTMQGGKTTAPGEVRGSSIEGGMRQKISPGDIMHIPPKTPHQVLLEPGMQITYFTFKSRE